MPGGNFMSSSHVKRPCRVIPVHGDTVYVDWTNERMTYVFFLAATYRCHRTCHRHRR